MPDLATRLLAEYKVIQAAPISFFTALVVSSALIWLVLNFALRTEIKSAKAEASSAKAETQYLDRKVKDYESKLQGLTPDEARSAFDEFERQLREQHAESIVSSEQLREGALVHVYTNEEGQARVRNADYRLALRASGFVRSATAKGQAVLVYGSGVVHGLAGLTPGSICFLAEGGAITHIVPAGAKCILQHVGEAGSHSSLLFKAGEAVLLA